MTNPTQSLRTDEYGSVSVERPSSQRVVVYWTPRPELVSEHPNQQRTAKLMVIDREERSIAVYPTNILPGHRRFLRPKHDQILSISVSGASLLYHSESGDFEDAEDAFVSPSFATGTPLTPEELALLPELMEAPMPEAEADIDRVLQGLPPGFTKKIQFGLGLAKPYWPIINAVEELSDCTEIVIAQKGLTGIDRKRNAFHILFDDFDALRKSLNRITRHGQNAARALKEATAYNVLAERVGETTRPVHRTSHETRQLIADALEGKESLDEEDQGRIVEAVSTHLDNIVVSNPSLTAKLHADIELVTLGRFINSLGEAIQKGHAEPWWQKFFTINPIALNLVFGCPVVTVHGQASVGGRRFSGTGDGIADFLMKNSITNNVAIVEIKKPSTRILNQKPYREGVYTPSSELTGAIGQVLDQKRKLQGSMAQLKENSRNYSLESHAIRGCVIVGKMPEDEDRVRAFELIRGNSKDVDVVTYDELLEKVRRVRDDLDSSEAANTEDLGLAEYGDLPF